MKLSKYIDHTLLKPNATKKEIEKLCKEAKKYDFASVCINPCWVKLAKKLLKGTTVKVCTVIGFPLGQNTTLIKGAETQAAIKDGADEIDMVINVSWVKQHDVNAIVKEIALLKAICKKRVLKVIIETCLLTDAEKTFACKCAVSAGADFVKTSTGFSTGGATVHDVELMKKTVGKNAKVKASGGIKTPQQFKEMIKAGAERIGTSNGCNLVK